MIPRVGSVKIRFSESEDGRLCIWSDDLPGLILSGSDHAAVWRDLGVAISTLLKWNEKHCVDPKDQTTFVLNADDWNRLQATLDNPPPPTNTLKRLMRKKPLWD